MLKIIREVKTTKSTIGTIYLNGLHWDVLEDVDRGLLQSMSLEELLALKVPKQTAIPCGEFEIDIDESNRFKRKMPHILNVPAFSGIRIHWGNEDIDTDGCPLVGNGRKPDEVIRSIVAFNEFFIQLELALKFGKCNIIIESNYA